MTHSSDRPDDDPAPHANSASHPALGVTAAKTASPEPTSDDRSNPVQAAMENVTAQLAEAKSPVEAIETAARGVPEIAQETLKTVQSAAEEASRQTAEIVAPAVTDMQAKTAQAYKETTAVAQAGLQEVAEMQAKTAKAYKDTAAVAQTGLQDMALGFSDLNWKLLQFARVNMQNSVNFVQELAGARSLPDILRVQAAYMQTQSRTFNDQMRELQTLTSGLTQSAAAPFKEQVRTAGRLFTSC